MTGLQVPAKAQLLCPVQPPVLLPESCFHKRGVEDRQSDSQEGSPGSQLGLRAHGDDGPALGQGLYCAHPDGRHLAVPERCSLSWGSHPRAPARCTPSFAAEP